MINHSYIHDGLIFHYSAKAIERGDDLIGFYFDRLGFPQKIHKDSTYGIIVKRAYAKE